MHKGWLSVLLATTTFGILFSAASSAQTTDNIKTGDVIKVTLGELNPTQSSLGYDEVYYKLGRYQRDSKKIFDDICETFGQKGVLHFDKHSTPNHLDSFRCKAPVGTEKQEMKTVVIGPDNHYYLTDGHHTFTAFWQLPEGGASFPVYVLVSKDYRQEKDMTDFWQSMILDNNAWLYNISHNPISWQQLPKQLKLNDFDDDPYRSLVYFTRGIAWQKPTSPVPFLEFYWADSLKSIFDITHYNLNDKKDYLKAITDMGETMIHLTSANLGGSGYSAIAMGQYSSIDKKQLHKLTKTHGKLNDLLRYKNQQ